MAEALNGREYRYRGWAFRLKVQGSEPLPGTWYGVTLVWIPFPYRNRPPPDDGEFFVDEPAPGSLGFAVVAQPRSPGAYLVAQWEGDWGFRYDESTKAADPE